MTLDGRPELPKVGRNDPCFCGSGLKFKKCCIRLSDDRTPSGSPEVGTYVHYEDLWPREASASDVLSNIGDFAVGDLLPCLAKLNVVLRDHYTTPDSTLERQLLRDFLPDIWRDKVILAFKYKNRKTAFFRTQMLAAIRLALLCEREGHPSYTVYDNLTVVGEVLLKISSLVDKDPQRAYDRTQDPVIGGRHLLATAYRYSFYNHSENFGTAIGRFWAMMTKGLDAARERYSRQFFDLRSEFENAFGFSILQMLAQGVGIQTHFNKTYRQFVEAGESFAIGERYFQYVKSKDVLRTVHLIFRYLSLPLSKHIEAMRKTGATADAFQEPLEIFSLYDRPMVELRDGVYIPLDLEFVRQRMTDGVYWAVFNHLKAEGREKDLDRLRSSFGHVAEWYAAEILRSTFSHGGSLWLDWDGDFSPAENIAVPDAVIREEDTLFFVEVTASALPPQAAVSCDPQIIEDGLTRLWFGKGEGRKSAKILQLYRAIAAFKEGRLSIRGVDPEQISSVIPMLVSLRHLPLFAPLRGWYDKIIQKNGVPESFTNDLQFLNLEELELLASARVHRTDWKSIFRNKNESEYKFSSLNNFLIFTRRSPDRHPWIEKSLKEAFNSISKLLFDAEFIPPDG